MPFFQRARTKISAWWSAGKAVMAKKPVKARPMSAAGAKALQTAVGGFTGAGSIMGGVDLPKPAQTPSARRAAKTQKPEPEKPVEKKPEKRAVRRQPEAVMVDIKQLARSVEVAVSAARIGNKEGLKAARKSVDAALLFFQGQKNTQAVKACAGMLVRITEVD